MKDVLCLVVTLAVLATAPAGFAQEVVIVRPQEIDDVLVNPGIGFMTFQRFNGDELNPGSGWTEGLPIQYQEFDGDLTNPNHPPTSLAYFRVNWRFVEPEKGQYNWEMIDKALRTASERGQTLILRISCYEGTPEKDVPDWYRKMVGESVDLPTEKWQVDPEDPRYVQYFGGMIRALGERYDGHPDLECVDMSLVGYWGGRRRFSSADRENSQSPSQCLLRYFSEDPFDFSASQWRCARSGSSGERASYCGQLAGW